MKQDDMLTLRISDNGKGFHMSAQRKRHSFGLIGIEERVLALNGKLKVDSDRGRGTSLVIVIPIEKKVRREHFMESGDELNEASTY
jgi:signal transduction histidine kinase